MLLGIVALLIAAVFFRELKLLLVLLLLVLVWNFPDAKAEMPQQEKCMKLAAIYESAADGRNKGMPPQMAFDSWKKSELGVKAVKTVINQVYFDQAFAYAFGPALRDQVYYQCMGQTSQWEPLEIEESEPEVETNAAPNQDLTPEAKLLVAQYIAHDMSCKGIGGKPNEADCDKTYEYHTQLLEMNYCPTRQNGEADISNWRICPP